MLYILRKGEKPELRIGTVTAVTDPVPKFGQTPIYGQQMATTVDISVKVDGTSLKFEKLDSGAAIMTYPNENTVVASSREAMAGEVEAMIRNSRQIIDSIPYHRSVLESCDGMLRELNPQFAKEKEQEEKLGALEGKVTSMETTLTDIRNMLSSVIAGNCASSRKKDL